MDIEPTETFYMQPGALKAAEGYQAKGCFTRVGWWKGMWGVWAVKKDERKGGRTDGRTPSAPTSRSEVIDG